MLLTLPFTLSLFRCAAFACSTAYLATLAAAQLPPTYYDSLSAQSQGSFRRAVPFRSSFRGNFRRQAPTGNPADDAVNAPLTQEQEPQQAAYGNGYANGGNGGAAGDQIDLAAIDEGAAGEDAPADGGASTDVTTDDIATDPDAPINEPSAEIAEDGDAPAADPNATDGQDGDEPATGGGSDLDGLRTNIRGEPDVDYPIFAEVPKTSFKCSERERPGYYGDPEARCQVFHICQADDRMDSFLCPNGTIFSQKNFVCVWWWQYDCAQTEKDWALNENLWLDANGGSTADVDGASVDGGDGDSAAVVDSQTSEEGSNGIDSAAGDSATGDGGAGYGGQQQIGDGADAGDDLSAGTKGGSSQASDDADVADNSSDLSAPADDAVAEDPAADPAPAAVVEDDAQTTEDTGSDAPVEDVPGGRCRGCLYSNANLLQPVAAADALVDANGGADDSASADLTAGAYKNGYAANGYSRNGNGVSSAAKAAGRFSVRFGVRGGRRSSIRSRSRSRSRSSLRFRSRSSLRRSRGRFRSRSSLRSRRLRFRSSSRRSRSRSALRRRSNRRRSSSRSSRRRFSSRRSGRRSVSRRSRRFRQRFASRRFARRARN